MHKGLKNIRNVMEQATDFEIDEGRRAYFGYHQMLRRVQQMYSEHSFETVVAVFADLSPSNRFEGNVKSALTVLECFRNGVPVSEVRTTTYNHCLERAYSRLQGVDFWETSEGNKVRSFYRNIINPMDANYITIDGHAVNLWKGQVIQLKAKEVQINDKEYEAVSTDFKKVAKEMKLLPNQLQAITWWTWKRMQGIFEQRIPLQFWCEYVHTIKPFTPKSKVKQLQLF